MQGWQSTYLGAREVPRELSSFELQTFFTYSRAEHELIGRRRGSMMKLGLALHVGFLRMTGCPLNAFGILPPVLLRHLAIELDIDTPDLASLRALYARGRTLSDHQLLACQTLGFRWMVAHQRPALVRALRDEVLRCGDRERLLSYARQWLYQHRLIIFHERALRSLVVSALTELEASAAASIHSTVPPATWRRWVAAMEQVRPDGQHIQNWLWAVPAKHSTRQFSQVLERIEWLVGIGVACHPIGLNDVLVRRFAHRLAARSPSLSARIKEPARTLEMGCFLRYCLLTATDQLILMFQRRVADLWRQSADGVTAPVDWAAQYRQLLDELASLNSDASISDAELRSHLAQLVAGKLTQRIPSRSSAIRQRLIDAVRPVRASLVAIAKLPWQAIGEHPVIDALGKLRDLYARGDRRLPDDVTAPRLGQPWLEAVSGADRERAFRAFEVATLFALRRAVRNGSVWIEHSLSFRGRERLFLPAERWQAEARRHHTRLSLPAQADDFLRPLLERVRTGIAAVAAATRAGTLRVDDELHLAPLAAQEEDPEVSRLRARLDHHIGDVQLPEVILAVDAQARFSWPCSAANPGLSRSC